MGQNLSEMKKNSNGAPSQGSSSAVQGAPSQGSSNAVQSSQVALSSGGTWKKLCRGKKKNMKGGMATVGWDKFPMNQPSNQVMERATTADRLLYGGRRRTHKRRGNKKSHKVKRHHQRSKRHHKKRH